MAANANLAIYQGDDYVADILVTDDDGTTPADLTGCAARSQIREDFSPASPLIAEFECVIEASTITIALSHDITSMLTCPKYVWDIQVTDGNGWVTTLLAGQVAVTKEVTKLAARAGR
jgi:hypothetical protein